MTQQDLCNVLARIVKESGLCTVATISKDMCLSDIPEHAQGLADELEYLGLVYTLDGYLHASQEAFEVAGERAIAPDLFISLIEAKRRAKEADDDPRCPCGNALHQGEGDICLDCISALTELEMDDERRAGE